jgi:hypothetical protein
VLTDDAGHRDLPLWLLGDDGARISAFFARRIPPGASARVRWDTEAKASTAEELTGRLLQAAGGRVTDVDIDELGPGLAGEPRNLTFAEGLSGWLLDGSFREHPDQERWQDYTAAADNGTAGLWAATPAPAGFAFLVQAMWADDYRGSIVRFRGRLRRSGDAGRAGLFLRVSGPGLGNPLNWDDVLAEGGLTTSAADASPDWAQHEVTARVPGDCRIVAFGVFLAGRGRIELLEPELTRVSGRYA